MERGHDPVSTTLFSRIEAEGEKTAPNRGEGFASFAQGISCYRTTKDCWSGRLPIIQFQKAAYCHRSKASLWVLFEKAFV